ncbi:MAG: ATP-binding cassette domain-containing protein [Anaerolineae bacterium]
MLTLEKVTFGYGAIQICHEITLEIQPGEVVCLLGRNGMGKTTLLEGLMGLNQQQGDAFCSGGKIFHASRPIGGPNWGWAGCPRASAFSLIFQCRITCAWVRWRRGGGSIFQRSDFEVFPILQKRLTQKGNTLSGGEQQMLAFGRALSAWAALDAVDEPSEGLAPLVVDAIGELITRLKAAGMTFLLAEQNLPFALSVANRGYVLKKGRIVDSGDVAALQGHKVVRDYLMV